MPIIAPQTPDEKAAGAWTDSARILGALAKAEERFGPRDASFNLVGFDFKAEGPRLSVNPGTMEIEIWIMTAIQNDPDQVLYQAAHEIIHVLSPLAASDGPSVLDEGLAQLFSEQHTRSMTGKLFLPPPDKQNYAHARDAVIAYFGDNDELVRAVQAQQPVLSRITPAQLQALRPDRPPALAAYLCSKFQG